MVSEWTATATDAEGRAIEWDGVDVFPFRDGLIARKDVYSGSHAPRGREMGAEALENYTETKAVCIQL